MTKQTNLESEKIEEVPEKSKEATQHHTRNILEKGATDILVSNANVVAVSIRLQ